jgi:two-component system, sensor histidine kinase and response regulator
MTKTFDIQAMISELELDREDVVELLQDFRTFLVETLPNLETAISSGDLKISRSLSHSIKGSAGNMRVNEVYQTALKMQDTADAGDIADLVNSRLNIFDPNQSYWIR